LINYLRERLLYRLSSSTYKSKFYLKGGAFLYAAKKEISRPTLDTDLLAQKISNDLDSMKKVFQEICKIENQEDGVTFDWENIQTEKIGEQKNYAGVRVKVMAFLGNQKQLLQIDIGFGDIIKPEGVEMDYPTLLETNPFKINAYTIDSVIAEKFHAMIDLAESNSRMKDFYDVFQLLNTTIDKESLKEAILATFKIRKTNYTENHPLFSDDFKADKERIKKWESFLNNKKLDSSLIFEEVMLKIKSELMGFYDDFGKEN
jgi:predicted nucleotidyltransferase component of viral defense system